MWALEGAGSASCLKTTPASNQCFAMMVLIWESPVFLGKTQGPLQALGRVIRQIPGALGPKQAGAADLLKSTLMSSSSRWVPKTATISFPSVRTSSWSGTPLSWSIAQLPRALLVTFECTVFLFAETWASSLLSTPQISWNSIQTLGTAGSIVIPWKKVRL